MSAVDGRALHSRRSTFHGLISDYCETSRFALSRYDPVGAAINAPHLNGLEETLAEGDMSWLNLDAWLSEITSDQNFITSALG